MLACVSHIGNVAFSVSFHALVAALIHANLEICKILLLQIWRVDQEEEPIFGLRF